MKSSRLIAFFAGAALVGCGGSRSSGLKDIAVGKFVSGVPVTITIGPSEASELSKVIANGFGWDEHILAGLNIEADEHRIDADQFWSVNRSEGGKDLPIYSPSKNVYSQFGDFFDPVISFAETSASTDSFSASAQFKIIDAAALGSLNHKVRIDAQILFSTRRNTEIPSTDRWNNAAMIRVFCSSEATTIGKSANIPPYGRQVPALLPMIPSLINATGQVVDDNSRMPSWLTIRLGVQTDFFDPRECKTDLKILFVSLMASQEFSFHGLTYTLLTEQP